jgi:CRP/FNR family cyclic AMP-dependent transcriptional regulator
MDAPFLHTYNSQNAANSGCVYTSTVRFDASLIEKRNLMAASDLINKVEFFSLLDTRQRITLTNLFRVLTLKKGEILFRFGDHGDSFYVVQSGMMELFVHDHGGGKISLTKCGEGHFFGELSLFDGGPRTATAVALEDTTMLALSREKLMKFLEQNPSAAMNMITVMGQRIRNTGDLLRQRVTRNVNEESEDRRTLSEKLADNIARVCGSMGFLFAHILFFAFWVSWNIEPLQKSGINWLGLSTFDPFPFGLLAMMVSSEAIILSTCLLISQNRQAAKDRIRADIEYEVNLKAELEVAHLHEKMDHMHAEVLARLHKFGESNNTDQRSHRRSENYPLVAEKLD